MDRRRQARLLLALPPVYDPADVQAAFLRQARSAHPDRGGDPEHFKDLVEGRRILLSGPPYRSGGVVFVDKTHRLQRQLARLRRRRSAKRPRVI
jgi:curved DNA-binding protein CbpA